MKYVLNLGLLSGKTSGLERFGRNMAAAASILDDVGFIVPNLSEWPIGMGKVENYAPTDIQLGTDNIFYKIKRAFWLKNYKTKNSVTYISPTHHSFSRAKNQVITIHDLIPLRFPEQNKVQYKYYSSVLPEVAKKAKLILTVSNFSKSEIVNLLNVPEEKVRVIHNVCNLSLSNEDYSAESDCLSFDKNYILAVGGRYAHKNLLEIIYNYECWAKDFDLIIVSTSEDQKNIITEEAKKFGCFDKIKFKGYVTDKELNILYMKAFALIYPSMYEGFGIPPVEALVRGTPAIVSDIPAHREVLGDCAIYFTIGDRESFRAAFLKLNNYKIKVNELTEILNKFSKEEFEKIFSSILSELNH